MNSRRTVIIAAALALAAIACFGTIYLIGNAKKEAYGEAKLVDVWVVKKAVPKGLVGSTARGQGFIERGQIPAEYRPGSALNEVTIKDIDGKVAINGLSPGQVVVDGQFVDPNVAQVTFAQRVPAGQVAITVSVDQVRGVAGLLVPGDKVDIMVVDTAGVNIPTAVRTLYQNVNILAVGNKPAPTAGEAAAANAPATPAGDSGLITLAVPLEAAERIACAAGACEGKTLYMALVPPDNTPVENLPIITKDNVYATGPTPYPVP